MSYFFSYFFGHGAGWNGREVNGLAGADVLFGTRGDDTIAAGAGRDVILAKGGDDLIDAGSGSDRVLAGSGDDRIIAGTGNDFISAGRGDDPIPLTIAQVQGSGAASARLGELVTAIVTGDFQDGDGDVSRNLSGFFLQEELADQDADASTSEGIFVFDGAGSALGADVQVGDRVSVTGTVSEFFGKTQISAASVTVDQAGAVADTATLAQSLSLETDVTAVTGSGVDFVADLEAYESMLVKFTDTLTVNETFQLDRFNEVRVTAGARPEQFTQSNEPDAAGFEQHLRDIAASEIVFDDGLGVQNAPIFAEADLNGDGVVTGADGFGMGDTVENLTGVLDFSFDEFRLRTAVDGANRFVDTQQREITPPDLSDTETGAAPDITVASFNVLNFFTTLDVAGNPGSGPDGLALRGADSQAEFDRQLDKLSTTLTEMNADIFGLVELENEFGDSNGDGAFAVGSIVDALNTGLGAEVWDYVDPGRGFVDTGDAISVGMIYRTDRVGLVEDSVRILDDSVLDSLPGDYGTGPVFDGPSTNRAPLAANFTYDWPGGSEAFTVAVTHMKSKGGTGTGNDADALDGQAGTLDYAFASAAARDKVTNAAVWNINSDEPDAYDYNLDFERDPALFDGDVPFRSSDHDPILVGLDFNDDLFIG